jgi:hypothetical protein
MLSSFLWAKLAHWGETWVMPNQFHSVPLHELDLLRKLQTNAVTPGADGTVWWELHLRKSPQFPLLLR